MSDYNSIITDAELRELLKLKILLAEDGNPLTQELIDAESTLVFSREPQIIPTLKKETELLSKFKLKTGIKFGLNWLILSIIGLGSIVTVIIVANNNSQSESSPKTSTTAIRQNSSNIKSTQWIPINPLPDSTDTLNENNNPILRIDNIPIIIEKTNQNKIVTNKTQETIVQSQNLLNDTKTNIIEDEVSNKTFTMFGKNMSYSCRIWETNSYCYIPDSLKFPFSVHCNDCVIEYIDCNEVASKNKTKAVWLTIKVTKKTKFLLESHFKNIQLVNRNKMTVSPVTISALGLHGTYITSVFSTKKFIASFNDRMDIIMLFPEAEVGDKIVIDDFIEAEIKE